MRKLFVDMLGFAAAKMIRRILGLAHNIDFEWIQDKCLRAACEARALELARGMMINAEGLTSLAHICEEASQLRKWQPQFH
jgi:5-methylthioribose kinase